MQLVIYFKPVGKFHPASERGCKCLLLCLQAFQKPSRIRVVHYSISKLNSLWGFFLHSNQVTAEILVQFFFLDYLTEMSGLWLETHGNVCSCQARSAFIVVGFTLRLPKADSTLLEAMKVYQV